MVFLGESTKGSKTINFSGVIEYLTFINIFIVKLIKVFITLLLNFLLNTIEYYKILFNIILSQKESFLNSKLNLDFRLLAVLGF